MRIDANNHIRMTRGDSETLTVTCEQRPFVEGDILELTMRESKTYPEKVLEKKVSIFEDGKAVIEADACAVIVFNPEDTSGLKFKEYVYDIQLTQADGTVTTIVKPAAFTIEFEVTYDG